MATLNNRLAKLEAQAALRVANRRSGRPSDLMVFEHCEEAKRYFDEHPGFSHEAVALAIAGRAREYDGPECIIMDR